MSSTMQVQGRRQEPAANVGVQIVSVDSTIQGISVSTSGRDGRGQIGIPFDFEVGLDESLRTKDSLKVKYAFSFSKPSSGQVCKINGTAMVRFSQFNPNDFQTLGDDVTNEIAVDIFRENYQSVYLLLDTLKMEAPSPWITQEVSLSSRSQAAS